VTVTTPKTDFWFYKNVYVCVCTCVWEWTCVCVSLRVHTRAGICMCGERDYVCVCVCICVYMCVGATRQCRLGRASTKVKDRWSNLINVYNYPSKEGATRNSLWWASNCVDLPLPSRRDGALEPILQTWFCHQSSKPKLIHTFLITETWPKRPTSICFELWPQLLKTTPRHRRWDCLYQGKVPLAYFARESLSHLFANDSWSYTFCSNIHLDRTLRWKAPIVRERRRRLASNYESPSVPGWGI